VSEDGKVLTFALLLCFTATTVLLLALVQKYLLALVQKYLLALVQKYLLTLLLLADSYSHKRLPQKKSII
jgi:hypothetical protein